MVTPPSEPDTAQTMQRVRVGMTGLAVVLLLIGLASAILSSASRNTAVPGGAKSEVVANLTLDNSSAPGEPLVELGLTPSSAPDNTALPARPAK